MPQIDYSSRIYWDVILFPAVFAVVLAVFAIAAYIDMRYCSGRPKWKQRYLIAFICYLLSSVLMFVRLTIDLWRVAYALRGTTLNQWLEGLDAFFAYIATIALVPAVVVTIWCMLSHFRCRHSDTEP